ncbi:efflux RND transporter periplasmic adaptor subunit [Brachymonas sp. G13]|uniref:efflux RND transporter periplasmic adaptor subunit n=1 Tax=Brachymonas TaxID=28219 RepID=UPI0003762984|nr:efflux RND transporter periplasmic adaptor subunit [Brachymonas chironomi]NLX17250.1 efflux RND transporter periplasmic adaptor subunit [Ramlibacter sp.]
MMSFHPNQRVRGMALAAAVAAALSLTACGDKQEGAGGPAGAAQNQPPTVGVITVQPSTVLQTVELPGRLESMRVAEVRARVDGVVQRVYFAEGSDVRAGQPLFQIDNAPYAAALQSARASLARAQANLSQTSSTVKRYRPLVAANAISKQEFDNAVAAEQAARAEVLAGQAAVRSAQINVGYARVTAPISGRIGRSYPTEGALVRAAEGTLLATIQQLDTLKVNFTQSATEIMKLRRSFSEGTAGGVTNPEVKVILEDGSVYAHNGRLMFADVSVDESTGQVTLRAEVPNPERLLFPGLYVRVQLEQARFEHALLVPQQAVTRNSQGDTVLVVAADGSFAPRPVQVGPSQGSNWIITGGLNAGDQVIVDGVMKLRPGVTKVNAVPYTEKSGPGAAPAAAASGAAPAASGASAAPAATAASQPASAASAN